MEASPWSGRRLHFVGIGGCGMSGLALVARQLGAEVSGSDRNPSIFTRALADAGLEAAIGHDAANVPEGAELVVSTAVPADNPERSRAAERGQPELHRSELLAELTKLRRCVGIAGTHGKTTTTAMLVHVLVRCGLDPAFVIGGLLRSAGGHARWGAGDTLVVEADESDRSLLNLDVDVAVLLNAELDHHAHYASLGEVHEVFERFLVKPSLAILPDDPELAGLRRGPAVRFGPPADRTTLRGRQEFAWRGHTVALPLPGFHNAFNAVAALEAAVAVGAGEEQAAAALADFPGIARRFERLGETASGAVVYDDYGHHPTEVRAAVEAARELNPERLVVVFQPHLFSRTQGFAAEFGEALAAADVVVVCDVYPAREAAEDFPGVDGRLVLEAARRAGAPDARWAPTLDDAYTVLGEALRPGDLCLVLGAGDISTIGPRLVARERASARA